MMLHFIPFFILMFLPVEAKIGDDESVKSALIAARILNDANDEDRLKIAMCCSVMHLQMPIADERLTSNGVHPLLRFVAACLASSDEHLIKLASFIKVSYTKDKSFIERVFGFKWGAYEGNQQERDIYRIVEISEKKLQSGAPVLKPQAVSFMVQYKIFSTLGLLGAAVDYVDFKDMRPYDLWVNALWPDFFTPEDGSKVSAHFSLVAERSSEIERLVMQDPSFFYQKAKDLPGLMLAICDAQQKDTAVALLHSLQGEFVTYKMLEEQERAIRAFMLEEEEIRQSMQKEETLAQARLVAEEAKARQLALLPPSYTVAAGRQIATASKAAGILAAEYLLERFAPTPMMIDGFVQRAGQNTPQNLVAVANDKAVRSVDEAVDYLVIQPKPTAALVEGGTSLAIIKGRDGKIRLFTPSLQKAIKPEDSTHIDKPVVMTFDSAEDARKALRTLMPTMTSCTFYQKS